MAKRGSTRGFIKAVNKWTRETEERSEVAFQNTILEVYDELRKNTPVDTGNLRDAWVVSKNGSPIQTVTGPGDSPSQSNNRSGISQSIATIMSLKIGDRASIMNHATYFLRIERGFVGYDSRGRFFNQQGRWFAAKVFAQYRSIARRVATALKLQMR